MKASDMKPAENIFALFIGHSGAGKDCAAASFPTPMKIFDLDLRADGLFGASWLDQKQLEGIDITRVQPKMGFQKIEEELELITTQFQIGQSSFKTIYFGSVTSLEGMFLKEGKTLIQNATGKGHQKFGKVMFQAPVDYKYLYSAMRETMDYLRVMPVNVILSAHIVDRYGKDPSKPDNDYSENIVLGEKLTLTDKLAENIQIYFNEVYRFEKRMYGDSPRHFVKFRTDVAKTAYPSLPNGELEITNLNFYQKWKSLITKGAS